MAEDLYQTLGVTADADAKQVKKAYFRLVRKHPPEKDPEKFKTIRAAYETLSDPAARKSYDAMSSYGEELTELFEEAMLRISEDDWDGAVGPLKRLLVLDPNAHAARNQLGTCFAFQERFDDAQKVFQTLTKKQPDVALYWINLGHVLIEHAKSVAEDSPSRAASLMETARTHLKRAVEMESFNASPYLAIAESYLELERYDEAAEWTEKAIQADGEIDFQDFEAMFLHCIIYMRQKDVDGIRRTARRIQEVVPDEAEARKYVGARFAFMASVLVRNLMFDEAVVFVTAARETDKDSEFLEEFGANIDELLALHREVQSIEDDEDFIPQITMMVKCQFAALVGWEGHDYDEVWNEALQAIELARPDAIKRALYATRMKCPVFYRMNKELMDKLISVAEEQVATLDQCMRASRDAMLPNGLRALAEVFGNVATGYYKHVSEAEFERDWKMAMSIMENDTVPAIYSGIQTLRQRYPKLHAMNSEMFNTLESSARSATQQGGGGHSDAYANSDACFAGSTPVLLPDGSSTPMEQIEEGTLVVGVRGGETTACSVVRVDRHSPRRVVRLETDSASVVVTPNHRFARNGRWVRAGDLAVGDSIACIGAVAGRSLGTSTVTAVFLEPDPVPVFNIVVERPCTFVAGGLVVHSFTWLPRLRALLFGLPGLGGVVSPVPSAG